MTSDELEAASCQHSLGVRVVPLSSGSWAVIPSRASSAEMQIFQSLAEAEPMIRAIAKLQQASWERRQEPRQQPNQVLESSLEELGL